MEKQPRVNNLSGQREKEWKTLMNTWSEAFEKVGEVCSKEQADEIYNVTVKLSDPNLLEEYLRREDAKLKPEEKYFIQMSIAAKRFKER